MATTKKKKVVKQPAMRITRNRRVVINRLSDTLAVLAPATSPGKGFCVAKVAEEHGLRKFWKSGGNKKTMIARFLEGVLRQSRTSPRPS